MENIMNPDTHVTRSWKRTLDVFTMAFSLALLVAALVLPERVENRQLAQRDLLIIVLLYPAVLWSLRYVRQKRTEVIVRTILIMLVFSILHGVMAHFQHLLVDGWMDEVLIGWDEVIWGAETTLLLEKITTPLLTEWMMFAYVIYVPFLPVVAIICYRAGGHRAVYDYLLHLSLANLVCYTGFVLFPVANPMIYYPEVYSVPLDGWFFTWCGEWMRSNLHYPGGSLPSPHCAAATVMIFMLYRYNRKLFFIALPVVLTLYVSTVYGRYHYVWDGIAGIGTSLLILKYSPLITGGVASLAAGIKRLRASVRTTHEPAKGLRLEEDTV
jgi:membrane-associated phospholipid phosphatase